MATPLMRGAFVQVMQTFLLPVPNVILFQYNPDEITHGWSPAPGMPSDDTGAPPADPLAVKGGPGESFDFTLKMDSDDTLADGSAVTAGLATVSGLYPRLAALEMLLFPQAGGEGSLFGSVSVGIGAGGASASMTASAASRTERPVPAGRLPTVLFIWGPGRIVPVRVTSLRITETRYDRLLLHPVHAEAQVGLQVLAKSELDALQGVLAELARGASSYTHKLRQALAIANLANSAESVVQMLPL